MQTSLLGLAIAFIIALVAALIGPYFIDWNQFRTQFEAEASRALGAPVHVNGMLDARLLPTPTLRLRSVAIGSAPDIGQISADKLDVEFSLGALLRGEWRASELSLDGFSLDMGLDKQGHVEGPLSGGRFNLGLLTIDRLSLTGRVVLHDAASGNILDLNDFKFTGDVRAQAGTMRGEGEFNLLGARTPFRISSGQSADGKGTRLRFILDPGERALLADLDGILTFDALVPKFDGALTLARAVDSKSADAQVLPWRVSSKIKASSASATLEQIEANYGPDDNALKFSGAGDARFGASPLLHVALSARQLDADRVFGKTAAGEGLRVMSGLRRVIAALPASPFPAQLELAAEQIALGGRPIQNIAAELKSAPDGWTLEKFDMRAPGSTRVSATGTIAGAAFTGPVSIESAEPDALAAWLEGRNDIAYGQRAIRLNGDVTIAADRVGIAALKADIDGDLAGQVTLANLPDGKTRIKASLKSQSLNIDPMNSLLAKLVRPRVGWPDEAKISLDIARATIAGQDIRPVAVEFSYSPDAISLGRLSIGDASTVALSGSGSFNRTADGGKFTLNAKSASLERIGNFLGPFSPVLADRLKAVEAAPGDATLSLAVDIDAPKDQKNNLNVRAGVNIDAPQVKGTMAFTTTAALDAARGIDFGALTRSEINVETKLASDKSSSLLALLGLDRIVSAQDRAAEFESSMAGVWGGAARVKAKLSGAVDGDAQGTADVWSIPPKAALALAIRRADASALFDLKPGTVADIALSSRLSLANNIFTFDDLDATLGGSRMRGKIAVTRADVTGLNGEIGIDSVDARSVAALMFGAAGRDASEPLSRGLLRGWRGALMFQALKAELPGGGELRPLGGTLKGDGQSLTLDGKGGIGGGDMTASVDARQTPEGTSFNARVTLSDADGPSIGYRGLTLPAGKASAQLTLTSQGRSLAALAGAMSGAGSVTMNDMRLDGLDAAAFEAAVRASDEGRPTDDINLKAVVAPALAAGAVMLPSAKIPFAVKDGRLRVAPVTVQAPRAQVTLSGGYDLAADQTDVRVALSANVVKPETGRPDIRIDLNGPPGSLARTVDVASLSSWLAMRSIDRETRKLDQLERGVTPSSERELDTPPEEIPSAEPLPKSQVRIPSRDPRRKNTNANAKAAGPVAAPVPGATPQVQALPPPVNVKPAPGAAKPKPGAPVVLTP